MPRHFTAVAAFVSSQASHGGGTLGTQAVVGGINTAEAITRSQSLSITTQCKVNKHQRDDQ